METIGRSVLKAIIWNSIGLITMGIIGFIATGSVLAGGTMAVINTALGLSMYVIYERFWAGIRWGRNV